MRLCLHRLGEAAAAVVGYRTDRMNRIYGMMNEENKMNGKTGFRKGLYMRFCPSVRTTPVRTGRNRSKSYELC